MLDASERRPPAYFVYNTTQSSEGSPRRLDNSPRRSKKGRKRITNVSFRKSKAELLEINRRISAAEAIETSEKKIREVGFYIKNAFKPDHKGNYTAGHKDTYEDQLRKDATKHKKKMKELEDLDV